MLSRLPATARSACLALAVALLTAGAQAQPAEPAGQGDAVLQLLQDKGLLSKEPSGTGAAAVQRVRDKASELVLSAMNFLGVPYRRGGNSAEEGFDCSGFTRHIFEKSIGLVLPRRADEQASASGVAPVRREELRPGDLVFFNTLKSTFSHVGIYIGEGKFIHAPRSGSEVRIEDMRVAYWQRRFTGARRADAADKPLVAPDAGASGPLR
jgi:cell wall-associated NlpC family hydrolase